MFPSWTSAMPVCSTRQGPTYRSDRDWEIRMSATAGPRLLGMRRERPSASGRTSHQLPIGLIVRVVGGAALVAFTVWAVILVPGHSDFSAALRWAIAAMALDAVISWVFIEQHLNPRRPRRPH